MPFTRVFRKRKGVSIAPRIEVLGEVSAPSGVVIVIDTGLLHFWSGDLPPKIPDITFEDDEMQQSVANAVDFRIDGSDAERAGREFGRQSQPLYVFDVPRHGVASTVELFSSFARENDLDAHLVSLPERVPHRKRVDLALAQNDGAGEVTFEGIWASACDRVPRGRSLRVLGERMPEGPDAHCWRSVWLECNPDLVIARSERIGYAGVDEARLMFADVDGLSEWTHESLDGNADVVFWGRDAEIAAKSARAEQLSGDTWGWRDLAISEAEQLFHQLSNRREEKGWMVVLDFRLHSHHYFVMEQVRSTQSESGIIEVGGATMCTFMTSWGDGIFAVYRDLDADGRLVRIRIDLGSEEIVTRQRRFEEWWFGAFAKKAIISSDAIEEGVLFAYREKPVSDADSGWVLLRDSGQHDTAELQSIHLRDAISRDATLEAILRTPARCGFARDSVDQPFGSVRMRDR